MPNHPSSKVEAALVNLVGDENVMRDVALRMVQADGGRIYKFDFWANAAVKRSLALSSGFRTMIRDQNLTCAGALLRLQLDTALRFMAGFIVDQPHEFAIAVMEGNQINKLKDRDGNRMTDRYLVSLLTRDYPWVETVYKQTSNYVHFSDAHIFSLVGGQNDEDGSTYRMSIGPKDIDIPDETYLHAIRAFHEITGILMRYIEGWVVTKDDSSRDSEIQDPSDET